MDGLGLITVSAVIVPPLSGGQARTCSEALRRTELRGAAASLASAKDSELEAIAQTPSVTLLTGRLVVPTGRIMLTCSKLALCR